MMGQPSIDIKNIIPTGDSQIELIGVQYPTQQLYFPKVSPSIPTESSDSLYFLRFYKMEAKKK